ncbi:MAG: indolepyruvate oxidoreductase subunit beta family protein [Paracoccaceae bacterium]
MTAQAAFSPSDGDPRLGHVIKLAVMAVGGQGGGVLTGWIEALARANGYDCQATSVAGVAQRTGATIYYIEMAPKGAGAPVFALAPSAGHVDILIAAELMEAGRAIMRGFVTPDRTLLIGSTHRALAVSEKSAPGDGIADAAEVRVAAAIAARRVVFFDMEAVAVMSGSVISASLFGALAGAGALPFPRAAFEDAIRTSDRGVDASLRAFAAAYGQAEAGQEEPAATAGPSNTAPRGPARLLAAWQALVGRATAFPAPVAELAEPGLRKVVDFQDLRYGAEYLDRIEAVLALDDPGKGHILSREAAKYIANAMAYDDVIRVADLKTRGPRFRRIRAEMAVSDDQLLRLTEFMHPRADEIAGMLPARLGARVRGDPKWMARLDRWFSRGRRLRTDSLGAFLVLYLVGGLRGYRRRTLRHSDEQAHLERWLSTAMAHLPANYDLAVEVLRCRRLVKGYSDTHARGLSKFDRVLSGIDLVKDRADAVVWAGRLREAALKDEEGKTLDGALMTIRSFVQSGTTLP